MKKNKNNLSKVLIYLEDTINERETTSDKSYTSDLLKKSKDRISQKVGEEAIEVVIATNKNSKKQVIYESADLIFHLLVLWKKMNIKNSDIAEELLRRKNDK